MSAAMHRIRRLRWRVRVATPSAAFAQRQALRNALEGELLPACARAFDALGTGDEVLHIPQLKLRLQLQAGTDTIGQLASQLEQQLPAALRAALQPAAGSAPPQRLGVAALNRALLTTYLASGHIDWHADTGDLETLRARLQAEARQLAASPAAVAAAIDGTFAARLLAGFRLLQLLPPVTRQALLWQHAAAHALPGTQLAVVLRRLAASPVLSSFLQLRAAAMLLASNAADMPDPRSEPVAGLLAECAAQLAASGAPDIALLHAIGLLLGRTAGRNEHARDGQTAPDNAPPATAAVQPPSRRSGAVQDPHAPADEMAWRIIAAVPESVTASAQAPGVPVNDAGMILLHPFLPRLFEAAGICAVDGRLPARLLARAAALLHWLASGREQVFEFELALIKVLLGLEPGDPLPAAAGLLDDSDHAEADALLAAAIGYWPALRNTSIAGLRASFLQRRGLLRAGGRGWQLQVETEAYDLLLGQLPWGISIVKLPWMTRPIFTDWPTP